MRTKNKEFMNKTELHKVFDINESINKSLEIEDIKKDLIKNNIKDNVTITKSNKHYFLNLESKRFDIFRAFNSITELKTYLYNTLKIKEVK